MKLIIAGSRSFTNYQLLCQTLAPERLRITQELLFPDVVDFTDKADMVAVLQNRLDLAVEILLIGRVDLGRHPQRQIGPAGDFDGG